MYSTLSLDGHCVPCDVFPTSRAEALALITAHAQCPVTDAVFALRKHCESTSPDAPERAEVEVATVGLHYYSTGHWGLGMLDAARKDARWIQPFLPHRHDFRLYLDELAALLGAPLLAARAYDDEQPGDVAVALAFAHRPPFFLFGQLREESRHRTALLWLPPLHGWEVLQHRLCGLSLAHRAMLEGFLAAATSADAAGISGAHPSTSAPSSGHDH